MSFAALLEDQIIQNQIELLEIQINYKNNLQVVRPGLATDGGRRQKKEPTTCSSVFTRINSGNTANKMFKICISTN